MWLAPDNPHDGLLRVGALCGPPLWSSGPDYHFPSLPLCVFGAWQPTCTNFLWSVYMLCLA